MTPCSRKLTSLLGLLLFAVDLGSAVPVLPHRGESKYERERKSDAKDIENQLENLKENGESTNSSAAGNGTAPHQMHPKSELNMEEPTASDNSPPDSIWDVVDQLSKREGLLFPKFRTIDLTSTPRDIAEYIFWTGNEQGVTRTLAELLNNAALSKEEAIPFLEMIKSELESIRRSYKVVLERLAEEAVAGKPVPGVLRRPIETLPAIPVSQQGVISKSAADFQPKSKGKALSPGNEDDFWNDYAEEIVGKVGESVTGESQLSSSMRNKIHQLAADLQRLSYGLEQNGN